MKGVRKMKLVELLARELKAWPDGAEFYCQDYNRNAYPYEVKPERHEHRYVLWGCKGQLSGVSAAVLSDIASDHATAIVTRSDWAAERARIAKPAKKADKGGWIRHRGGKPPVADGVKVDYRMRNGSIDDFGHKSETLDWAHCSEIGDIMAYKLHNPAEQVDACSKPDPRDSAKRDSDYVCWMRDRITEIDATTSALTTERAELVQKLASEGFALIGRAHDAPIGLPRDEWKVGDLVMLKCESLKTDMPVGKPLPITEFDGSSFGQDVKVDGFYFPLVSDLIWHSRPSA